MIKNSNKKPAPSKLTRLIYCKYSCIYVFCLNSGGTAITDKQISSSSYGLVYHKNFTIKNLNILILCQWLNFSLSTTNIVFVHKKVPPRCLKTTKKFCPTFYWKYVKYSQFFSTVGAVLKSSHTLLSIRFWKTQIQAAETLCHAFIHHLPCHLQEHLTFSPWTSFTLIFYSFFFVRSCWNVRGLGRNCCGLPFLTPGIPLSLTSRKLLLPLLLQHKHP